MRGINSRILGVSPASGQQLRMVSCWIPGEVAANSTSVVMRQTGEKTFNVYNTVSGATGQVRLMIGPAAVVSGDAVMNVHAFSAGSGATATTTLRAKAAAIKVGGTGYTVGDVLTLVGGTSTAAATFTVATVKSGGVATLVPTVQGSYTALPGVGAATTGGTGTGCTLSVVWEINTYVVTAGGSSYVAGKVDYTNNKGATAFATITAGAVTALTPVDRGSFPATTTTLPAATVRGVTVAEHVKKFHSNKVFTFEGHTYFWHENGTSPDATFAVLPFA